ncbi:MULTISPECIES: GNAT family N-acetyltransferase [Staphylococcus]|uniref:GNAT family N-acetyltransferase n=1 Tax=Staphylococcus TaxID=1279 RepID=UPI001C834024|nr:MULTISPECIES: GNAT family N-acetyltransferase [Staphylococcus]MBX5320002.1 GNAT family N-acetyltransferase [Staphylococcus caprae]MCR6086775.1 GNAT family N-acetyltransferase [Staphylococcus aureus]MDI9232049.1 GNAT family N-acetyltransferase [Staphylococcus caprae]
MYIKAYKSELYHQVANLEVLESDSKFTKTPLENIKSAQEDADRHPTLVMKDGVCVAFFTLHEGDGPKDYTDNSQAIFFRSFSVDQRYRGRGIGKRTIELLPSYVKDCYPHINEITLAVNTDNKRAIDLYQQAGYQHTHDSELVGRPVHVMTLDLK